MKRSVVSVVALAALPGACSQETPAASRSAAPGTAAATVEAQAGSFRNALATGSEPGQTPERGQPQRYVSPEPPDPDLLRACEAGLKAKGLEAKELQIMLGIAEGICPNLGVTEQRIREIAEIWEEAGCRQYSKEQVLRALNSGECGAPPG